jgi:hypothetical protein
MYPENNTPFAEQWRSTEGVLFFAALRPPEGDCGSGRSR